VIHESSDVASAAVVDSTGDDSRNCTQTRTGTYCCFREEHWTAMFVEFALQRALTVLNE